jgi:hypothetical protein
VPAIHERHPSQRLVDTEFEGVWRSIDRLERKALEPVGVPADSLVGFKSAAQRFRPTGVTAADGVLSASRLVSTVADGTAPLTVASGTKVTNLNADKLDGLDSTGFALSGHTHAIDHLTDVTIDGTPADNEVLAYDTGSSKFINQTAAEAGLSATGHTHDHGTTTGKGDDDHTIYALLAGRAGGQTLIGGTGVADYLELQATASGSPSGDTLRFALGGAERARFAYSAAYGVRLGIGTTTPGSPYPGDRIDLKNQGIYTATIAAYTAVGSAGGSYATRASAMRLARARGSYGSELDCLSGDVLGQLVAHGYHTDWHTARAKTRFILDAAPDANDMPTAYEIHTGSSGTNLRVTIASTGIITIKGTNQLYFNDSETLSWRSNSGELRVKATKLGLYDAAAVAQPTYTPSNAIITRSYDCDATTLDELADVVATIIYDMQQLGPFK